MGKILRVGISTTTYEWHLTGGIRDGIGVYTANLLSALQMIDDVEVRRFYYPQLFSQVIDSKEGLGATAFRAPFSMSGFLSHAFNITDINNDTIKKNVDVYHCTDYKIPKLKNTPVVATLHDAIPLKHPEWVSARMRWLKNKVLVNSAKWTDHIITVSHYTVDDIVNFWGVPREKISVVYNGVSEFWSEQQSLEKIHAVTRKYNITKPFMLSIGTFQPRKNIGRVIQSYNALPRRSKNEHQIVLVGKKGWKSEELMGPIKALENKGDCVWINEATDEDLRCLYQGSRVFLFASLSEGFGLPVLEAFASRVPVITSRGTALEEIAGGAAYLVDPFSVEDMVSRLDEVLSMDHKSIQDSIDKGLQRCRQFTWAAAAEQNCAIYKSLL